MFLTGVSVSFLEEPIISKYLLCNVSSLSSFVIYYHVTSCYYSRERTSRMHAANTLYIIAHTHHSLFYSRVSVLWPPNFERMNSGIIFHST
jgi:hypothetical protein